MPLQKQPVNINFSQGLNTKVDPFQIPPGQFLALENTIFTKGGLLQKRNGFAQLSSLPDSTYEYVTSFNGNLTAVGTTLAAYSSANQTWASKGTLVPIDLETLPLIRSSSNQAYVDTAIASNGLVCTVYTNSSPSTTYNYVIADSTTGQNIVAPTLISTPSESPRVFLLGQYFIILFSQAANLKYIAIPITNPSSPNAAVTIITNYAAGGTQLAFDGVVANNILYIAYNGNDGGGAIRMTYLNSFLALQTSGTGTVVTNTKSATMMSICADTSSGAPVIWLAWYKTAGTEGWVRAVDQQLTSILVATQIISAGTILNITCTATAGSITAFFEVSTAYAYGATLPTNIINKRSVTSAGVVGAASTMLRSVGLASKAFILSGTTYMLTAYSSSYQPSYFLVNSSGSVVAKLAYSNGGGYLTLGLPSVTVTDTTAQVGYLIRDLLVAANKSQNPASNLPVFTQTGVNLASFDFISDGLNSSEIGSNLNFSGGILWAYDGYQITEQGFNVWPDNVVATTASTGGGLKSQIYYYVAIYEWTDLQGNIHRSAPSIAVISDSSAVTPSGVTFTSVFSSGATSITASSATGLFVGQLLTDTTTGANIAAGTTITSIVGTTIGLSLPTAGNSAAGPGDTIKTIQTNTNTIKIPTLRLTYKTGTPVKIVLYRWSTAQQIYYQVTSLTSPTLNDTTADSVTITDTSNDLAIVGNSILYTTGGVVENIGPPSVSALTLFKSRLFLVDAEDRNLLWFSKQVIEATPVEMSDLFTIFVAPTVSAQGNTGPITALSAMDDKLIIFKENAIYYLTGTGPDNTGANNDFSDPIFITSTVGCNNQKSIVFTPNGLMFQSDKGIWLLGRDLSTQYIGAAVENFNASLVLSALTVPATNQVRFVLNTGEILMYDYFFNQWGSFTGISNISSTLFQDLHTFIDSFGRVFQENAGSYLDGSRPVLINFLTGWMSLSGLQGFERAYWLYILASYVSPHKLTVTVAYDYNASPTQTTVITPDNFAGTYGNTSEAPIYGNQSPYGGPGELEQWRVFFQKQKCESFQIGITESFDSSKGVSAGAGFTMSGMNLTVGLKKGYTTIKAARSVG